MRPRFGQYACFCRLLHLSCGLAGGRLSGFLCCAGHRSLADWLQRSLEQAVWGGFDPCQTNATTRFAHRAGHLRRRQDKACRLCYTFLNSSGTQGERGNDEYPTGNTPQTLHRLLRALHGSRPRLGRGSSRRLRTGLRRSRARLLASRRAEIPTAVFISAK